MPKDQRPHPDNELLRLAFFYNDGLDGMKQRIQPFVIDVIWIYAKSRTIGFT